MHPYFVGLDVHKQVIAFCVKTRDGEIVSEGSIRRLVRRWMSG
jgi:hypothetical protein